MPAELVTAASCCQELRRDLPSLFPWGQRESPVPRPAFAAAGTAAGIRGGKGLTGVCRDSGPIQRLSGFDQVSGTCCRA